MHFKETLTYFILTILGISLLQADPVTTIPDSFNLLQQSEILGDGFGYRKAAEDHGVVLSAQSTSDLFGNTIDGAATGTTYSGLLNLGLAIDLQKAVGWEGASFKNTWLWLYGSNVSARYVGNALTVSSIAGNPGFRCYELWFQQNLFHDAFSLRVGLLGLDTEFMLSDAASLFINSTFGPPSLFTLSVPNGGPTYPLATPGIRLALQPTSWITFRSAFSQANPFTQTQNLHGFDSNFGSSGGLLSLSEVAVTWNKNADSKGLPGTAKAGFWLQTGQDLDSSETAGEDSFAWGSPESRRFSSGYYAFLDQQLYAEPSMPSSAPSDEKNPQSPMETACICTGKGLSGFARIGFSPQLASQVGFYSDAGLAYTGLIPTRDNDKLGIAFAYAQMGSQYAAIGSESGLPGVGYEGVAELSYAMQLVSAVTLQPDLQYILHPGGTQQYGNALVVGVRAVVNF